MPPKKPKQPPHPHSHHPQSLPIYEILSDKEQQNGVRKVVKKVEALMKHDVEAVERSYCGFVLRVCGVDVGGDLGDVGGSLGEVLEQMCQQTHKSSLTNQLLLINQSSTSHKPFLKSLQKFLQISLSPELPLLTDTQILKNISKILLTLGRCKLRNIRHCSVVFGGFVMRALRDCYGGLVEEKENRRAGRILGMLEEYLGEFVKPRLKDVDSQIREKAFQITNQTVLNLPANLLTPPKLHTLYTQILTQNNPKITELCLKSLLKIFQSFSPSPPSSTSSTTTTPPPASTSSKSKQSPPISRNFATYAHELIKTLQQLVLIPNRNSCLAMDILMNMHGLGLGVDCLRPKIIGKVFQIHGFEKFQDGLKKAVAVFFRSLVDFRTKEDLVQHRSLLIVEITHLLCSINSSRLLSTILHQFFVVYPHLFTFDEMFLLLLTEYYNRQGSDIQLQQKQLHVLCTMICEFNTFLRSQKLPQSYPPSQKQSQSNSYNKNTLTNAKQIFYQKMPKHHTICHLYLRLFSLLFTPISGHIGNFVSFVEERTLNFVREEKYLSIAGDDLGMIQMIVGDCVGVFLGLGREFLRVDLVGKCFGVGEIVDKDKFDDIDIVKIAALTSKFQFPQLTTQKILKKLLLSYTPILPKTTKLNILTYCHTYLKSTFTSLFTSPSIPTHQQHLTIRTIVLNFLLHTVLPSSTEDTVIKVAGFNVVCRIWRLVCNSRIGDLGEVFWEVGDGDLGEFYGVVGEFVGIGIGVGDDQEEGEVGEATMMMASVSLEAVEVREQILMNLFQLFAESLKITLHKYSIRFLINFMSTSNPILKQSHKYLDNFLNQLIKSQISTQNNNKFIFWRVYMQIVSHLQQKQKQRNTNTSPKNNSNKNTKKSTNKNKQKDNQQIDYIKTQEQKDKQVIDKLIDSYYRYRKNQAQVKSLLSNKLMLYVADSIDKCVNTGNYGGLEQVKYLLGKTKRRFQKEILQRLYIFFCSKIVNIEDKKVKNMKDFLNKISKIKKPKSQKQKQSSPNSSQSQKEQNNASQNEDNENSSNNNNNRNEDDNNQQNIMIQKSQEKGRRTRSQNKNGNRNNNRSKNRN